MLTDIDMHIPASPDQGACVPMSYLLAESVRRFDIPARVVETVVAVTADGDIRTARTEGKENGFLGHTVVYLPTKKWMIDVSLHTQKSQVIKNAMPSGGPVFIDFDHNHHEVAEVPLERGRAVYEQFRFAGNKWHESKMPWQGLDKLATSLVQEAREAGL